MGLLSALFKKEPKRLTLDTKIKYNCPSVTIVYGTKTGNAQLVAQQTQKSFEQSGIDSECFNIAKYPLARVFSENLLLIVMSTDGEGEVPPNTRKFLSQLKHNEFPPLNKLNYSICALGDSSYEYFCGAGQLIEERLIELGAVAAVPRINCDLDFKDSALDWIKQVFGYIRGELEQNTGNLDESISIDVPDLKNSTLLKRIQLSKGHQDKASYHIVLDNSKTNIPYKGGDCIEIIPENPDKLVEALVEKLGIDTQTTINGSGKGIIQLLTYNYELTKLTRNLVKAYQLATSNEALLALISDKEKLKTYADNADVLDLISDYPGAMSGEDFIKLLRPMHSRYYSISSSYDVHPDEIHLCIKTVRFEAAERQYEGAASVFMNEGLKEGASIPFNHVPNQSFHLIDDSQKPVILIGVGTGIAPYRSFLQDRKAHQSLGKTWLIWGDKKQAEDYIYEDELKAYKDDGTLHRLDVCFSRDQQEKIYVQNLIEENKTEIFNWIENGAHLYLCGHTHMGHGVRNTLASLLIEFKNLSLEEANAQIVNMQENGILHEDLY